MKFNPISEEEIQTASLAPEGIYRYRVLDAIDGVSRAGNEKVELVLKIWEDTRKEYVVFTNLSLIKLLKHFCDANNMQDQYKTGEIRAAMCQGKSGGMVEIGIEQEKPNPNGGMFKAKNIVKDYILSEKAYEMKPLPEVKNELNDDLPF